MQSSFGRYAEYYDQLYDSKDYERECDLIAEAINRFSLIPVRSILDIGCGTGGHLIPLASRGWQVDGIDSSEAMLSIAKRKLHERGLDASLHQADARSFELDRRFDAIICMFAVLGYVTDNAGLASTFDRIRRHLAPGGILMVDFWYGPTVLTTRPSIRVLRREVNGLELMRLASPSLDIARQTTKIHYELWAMRNSTIVDHLEEDHVMRFFFPQEVDHYLEQADFEMLGIHPFPELDGEITQNDWNALVIGRAKSHPETMLTQAAGS